MKNNLLLTVFLTFVLYSCSDYYEECVNKATQSIPWIPYSKKKRRNQKHVTL